MWPVANWEIVRVCSQGVSSSSHAWTASWRADERECMTPSMSALARGSAAMIAAVSSGERCIGCSESMYNLKESTCSYLSSSRSSTIASFVIFAGGSASSSYVSVSYAARRILRWTHALGFGARTPQDVKRQLVACLFIVGVCVMSFI